MFQVNVFLYLKYEQNELSYMKIRQQIKKLVFLPSKPGGVMFKGVKKRFLHEGFLRIRFLWLLGPCRPHKTMFQLCCSFVQLIRSLLPLYVL